MTAQHTPGPWKATWREGGYEITATAGYVADVPITANQPASVTDANARLIAVAPELLAELRSITARFRKALIAGGTTPEFADAAIQTATSLIDRAEGR